jgi:hypothetical protein
MQSNYVLRKPFNPSTANPEILIIQNMRSVVQIPEVLPAVISGTCSFRDRNTVRSESRCALRLRYVDLVASIEVTVKMC